MRTLGLFALLATLAVMFTGFLVYRSLSKQLPDPDLANARGRDQSTIITDRNGNQLVKLYAEENRQDVDLRKMPTHLKQAVIATEDRRFYEHEGVDPLGILRALMTDVMTKSVAQGGSTITQQYVKQAFVTSERTLKRKLQEAILAQKIESKYSKDEILERYLNTIYFGHGSYGVESAARTYFGKSVESLSPAESAMIAGVIKSPARYSPYLEPENALSRRNTVLKQMLDQGYIDEATYATAKATPVTVAGIKSRTALAPYFVEWVKEQLVEKYGERMVYRGGLKVTTTIDMKAQAAAEASIRSNLDRKDDPSAALVSLDPETGAIVAMVGGRDFASQQFNVATQGKRQPGSAFKTFVLATALDDGVSPERSYASGAMKLAVGDQVWSVTGAHGSAKTMRLRQATEQSVNSVYAQLILQVGADEVVETAEKLGISKGITPVPAIALGGLEKGVSPLDMAEAYGTLAAGGMHAEPYGIARVTDAKGKELFRVSPKPDKALDPAVAYLTTDILKGVISRGTGKSAAIGRPAAGKTGTTQQYRDAWFVGYTPDLVTAVWVGYPDAQREMTNVHGRAVTGGSFPANIWAQFMKNALKGVEEHEFTRPGGLESAKVCGVSGVTPTQFCTQTITALMLTSREATTCPLHRVPVEVVLKSYVGASKQDAVTDLKALGLQVTVTDKAVAGVGTGIVASQNPPAGTKLKPGATVTLVVSTGGQADPPPVAKFTPPSDVKAGKNVQLDGSASTDDKPIAQYLWEFGDDTERQYGAKVAHVWALPGTYDVILWVTDTAGNKASTQHTVTVK